MDRICYSLLEPSSCHVCSPYRLNDRNKSNGPSQVCNHTSIHCKSIGPGYAHIYIMTTNCALQKVHARDVAKFIVCTLQILLDEDGGLSKRPQSLYTFYILTVDDKIHLFCYLFKRG